MLGSKTLDSISWSWSEVDGRGLGVTNYTVEYDVTNGNGTSRHDLVVLERAVVLSGLPRDDSVLYAVRVRACSTAGCSAYSSFAETETVNPPPATAQLAVFVDTIVSVRTFSTHTHIPTPSHVLL